MKRFAGMSAMLTLVMPVSVSAQDVSATPNYGEVHLDSGFSDDPRAISVRSGGTIDASDSHDGCRGYISSAPDVRLHYDAGSLPLILSVDSETDTTLVVNAPDGRWYCDDDGGEGMNPSVRFNSPQEGRYEIWVGTYGRSDTERAQLYISELSSH